MQFMLPVGVLFAADAKVSELKTILTVVGIFALVLILLFGFIFFLSFGRLYIQALSAKCKVTVASFIGMWLRKVKPYVIIEALITSTMAGIKDVNIDLLQAHYLAGGSVKRVVTALVAANKASIDLSFNRAAAIDLAGRDVFDAVRTSVQPKVIDCPNPASGRATIDAVAGDGIQLRARARVTVRTNLAGLIGGATEETIIARVGEGIVTTIGSAASHKLVLATPDMISKTVLAKGLDTQTAFEILSIDIADVDVGENIGAKLQAEQAESDKRVAQALAEKRRALAVAQEQENIAEIAANRAKVVLSEAQIPLALAEAFRSGNLGVFDYYRLKNLQADTHMRDQIARGPGTEAAGGSTT